MRADGNVENSGIAAAVFYSAKLTTGADRTGADRCRRLPLALARVVSARIMPTLPAWPEGRTGRMPCNASRLRR
jgi:hypothetical protein